MNTKKENDFVLWWLSLLSLLPVLSAVLESRIDHSAFTAQAFWKWFVFWAVGIRLFLKGIRLASTPQFTGLSLSSFKNRESYLLLLELGFANMALGSMGILSVINDQWRLIAAIAGGLYFGLAGMPALFKRPIGRHELIAGLYNVLVLAGLIFYLAS